MQAQGEAFQVEGSWGWGVLGFRVFCLGFGFMVYGLGFSLGFMDYVFALSSGFMVYGVGFSLGCMACVLGFGVWGSGFTV